MKSILIIDANKPRLYVSEQCLGSAFPEADISMFHLEKHTRETVIQVVKERCQAMRHDRVFPLIMSNIHGFKAGVINDALQATSHQMHGILATCWTPKLIAEEQEARKWRYRWARFRTQVTHLQCPNLFRYTHMGYADLLRDHLRALPSSNPYHHDNTVRKC